MGMDRMISRFLQLRKKPTEHQRDIRRELYELTLQGITLHNERIAMHDHAGWDERFEQWRSRVLAAAAALDPEVRAMLSPSGALRRWNREWAINADHSLAQNMIWETQLRIRKYLDLAP